MTDRESSLTEIAWRILIALVAVGVMFQASMIHELNVRTRRIDSELFRLESKHVIDILDRLDRLEKDRRP